MLIAAGLAAVACDDPEGPVRIAWTVPHQPGGGGWHGWPAVANGVVVVEDGPALRALDIATGTQQWRTTLRQGIPVNSSAIAIAAGRVFTAGADSVYALSLATGARLWAYLPASQAAMCQLSADSSAVYVGTRDHVLYALDAGTGGVRWSVDLGSGWAYNGFVLGTSVAGDTVYTTVVQELNSSGTQRAGHVFALSRQTGGEYWHYITPGQQFEVSGAAGVTSNLLLLGDGFAPGFFAVDRTTGQQAWRTMTAPGYLGVVSTPVVLNGHVFAGGQGGIYAVDLPTGLPVWKREDVPVTGATSVGLCNGILLVQNQAIQSISPSNGASLGPPLLDDYSAFPTSRIVSDGHNAVVTGTTAIYGLRC